MTNEFDIIADEADAFARAVASMQGVDHLLIRSGLHHSYDVIVAEALDFLITRDCTRDFLDDLLQMAHVRTSYIVEGRLRICAALTHSTELRKLLSSLDDDPSDYYKLWLNASKFLETRERTYYDEIVKSSGDPNKTISSLAGSLIGLVEGKV